MKVCLYKDTLIVRETRDLVASGNKNRGREGKVKGAYCPLREKGNVTQDSRL